MTARLRIRRLIAVTLMMTGTAYWVLHDGNFQQTSTKQSTPTQSLHANTEGSASDLLEHLVVKGRAPKTGYARVEFGGTWQEVQGLCDTRNVILQRDMTEVKIDEKCHVMSGVLADPYTGKTINFVRGPQTSSVVQIDHVVAVSNAWQTGAQQWTLEQRKALYNDPLELLAVDGAANNNKGDGDAATWLPPNKSFRCQYIARQIAVKIKYQLWITPPEKQAMQQILAHCPGQTVPDGALGK